MIFRKSTEAKVVLSPRGDFISHRYLTKADGLGFTVTKTIVKHGGKYTWNYVNHVEACLCIKGQAIVYDSDGKQFWLKEGGMYAPNDNKPHSVEPLDGDCILVCVFSPALRGDEVHKEDGSYEL